MMMQFHVQLVSCARYADSVADALCALSGAPYEVVDYCLIHYCIWGIKAGGQPCIYHDDKVHCVCCELVTH